MQFVIIYYWQETIILNNVSIFIFLDKGLLAAQELIHADDHVKVIENIMAILGRALDNRLEHSLDLTHALLDVLLGIGGFNAGFTTFSWRLHCFYLVFVYLKENLKDEMATERGVNSLL